MFGQLVIGPPGSGKTTYCNGMQQFLTAIGRCRALFPEEIIHPCASMCGRKVAIINLDPANDGIP